MPDARDQLEWMETDGLGGFAMGTVEGAGGGARTRRYHGLLIAATVPGDPACRTMLLNGFDAWVQTPSGRFDLTTQQYAPDTRTYAEREIECFTNDPWPKWVFRMGDGTRIEHEVIMKHGSPLVALSWRLCEPSDDVRLFVRPFVSGRDYHALHHENESYDFSTTSVNGGVAWRPYQTTPALVVRSNGSYRHEAHWYRQFLYEEERARGFDCIEDLASPGVFEFDLSIGEAIWIAACEGDGSFALDSSGTVDQCIEHLRSAELMRRRQSASRLQMAADQYIVTRGEGMSIIAGYPWFADWGRDTFIAMRGLCLATDRLDDARRILLAWSETISQGMLPNRFLDSSSGESATEPEYNAVDASLWFIIAAHELMQQADRSRTSLSQEDRQSLQQSILSIVSGYAQGTRYNIRMDERDGLLAAGMPGQQLTWMDARVDGREITPRIGKPVEVQALWLNALWIAGQFDMRWQQANLKGVQHFRKRFWNERERCLFDVIDEDHVQGKVDTTFRPNQIFTVGGLPISLLEGEQARLVVDAVEKRLLTPLGLRSLSQDDARYVPRYEGGPAQRDAAYHQGTVWPWLMGAFVEAWVRVRGESEAAKREARRRFIDPLKDHVSHAGIGHVSEIADAAPPHMPRGCPFQAWSVGELLRLEKLLAPHTGPVAAKHTVHRRSQNAVTS